MYKWNENRTEINAIINCKLEAIFFTENTIAFHFGKNIITIFFEYELILANKEYENGIIPISKTCLTSIIGKSVHDIMVENDMDLIIKMDDNSMIRIIGSHKEYECYHVNIENHLIII